MELEFKQNSLNYLKQSLYLVKDQEETSETIVPDSYPDIKFIMDSYANAYIRGKDLRTGGASISGGIKGGLVYIPEDGDSPRILDFYLPFTIRLDHDLLSAQSKMICKALIRSVDARMINSRKAMLRVDLSCLVECFEKAEDIFYEPTDCSEILQLQQKTYHIQLPSEIAEKSVAISDLLELPSNAASFKQLYKTNCKIELTEKKLIANKGVFRGYANIKMLYLSVDDKFYAYEHQIPFSQYCEFVSDYDSENFAITPLITGHDIELENIENTYNLKISVDMLLQGVVCKNMVLTAVEDAYSLEGELLAQWQHCEIGVPLDTQSQYQRVHCTACEQLKDIIDVTVYHGYPTVTKRDDHVTLANRLYFHLMGFDTQGELLGMTCYADAETQLTLSAAGRCNSEIVCNSHTVSLGANGLDVQADITWNNQFYVQQKFTTLRDAVIEISECDTQKPAIILKRAEKGAAVWSIAKKYRAKPEEISSVNHLCEDHLTETQMLLIPVG